MHQSPGSLRDQFLLQPFCMPIGDPHHRTGILQRSSPLYHHLQQMVPLPFSLAHADNVPFHNGDILTQQLGGDIFIKLVPIRKPLFFDGFNGPSV